MSVFFFLSLPLDAIGDQLLFHETFEDNSSIEANGGNLKNGELNFVDGVVGNGVDFSGSKAVCYSLQDNFDLNKGTVEFLVKTPNANHLGFFDIGSLGKRNSWGIFKNRNHLIMEVKNSSNRFDQAWSINPIKYDGDWHLVTAVWNREDEITNFKVCYDGNCKSNYDGITRNSFPNPEGNFCVGWCGWYGYSQSFFDEFKIFDFVKNESEMLDDYENYFPERSRPTITLLGKDSVIISIGAQYSDEGATAHDLKDGDITDSITKRDNLDTTKEGAYRIRYNVNDSDGNPAKEKIRRIFVVDFNVEPFTRAYEHIEKSMDKFHDSFNVYTDFGSGGNHGAPSGWMGYIDILKVDPKWDSDCYNGLTCFKNIWETNSPSWVGIRWLQPENNWGEIPNAGFDLTGATNITFHARGEVGGEPVEFLAGGVPGDHADSIQPAATTGTINLTKDWQKYTIELFGKNLTNVISPFGWTVVNDPIFYIDDVKYNLERHDKLRFIQSFELLDIDKEIALSNTSYVYDNALALLSFLARKNEEDLIRAKILADSFVFALENDRTYSDGRLRNAYMSGDLFDPVPGTAKLPGWWDINTQAWFEDEFNVSIHTGNMAWAMLALLSFYEMQGGDIYLEAVKKMGDWVERETRDERGSGGYTGGYEGWEQTDSNPTPPQKLLYKATEHNIDLYPAFLRLYNLTNEQKWYERSEHAKNFVESMWDSEAGHFWTGTLEDGITINKTNIPVDIQAWAVMAMQPEVIYNSGINWAESNCLIEKDGFEGFDFNDDLDGIWFEGTSQMAVGYQLIGELDKSDKYIAELRKAQTSATNANGKGLVAASHDNVTTGFDWEYFSRLHIGATAWFIFAEMKYNPYWNLCTVPDIDSDGDGISDCLDRCKDDPLKTKPEICGCGVAETDTDNDGTYDCNDECPLDFTKILKDLFYLDNDQDGYGDINVTLKACSMPSGYVLDNTDCDDSNSNIYPGLTEIPYDGIDQNCNGNDLTDVDEDSYDAVASGGTDCDDEDSTINPSVIEVCNGIDDNCNGQIDDGVLSTYYYDSDGDGFGDLNEAVQACSSLSGYVANSNDNCPNDPGKIDPGLCGCSNSEADSDKDGTPDCIDSCINDENKATPGVCGCGIPDIDTDSDGVLNCIEDAGPNEGDGNEDLILDSQQTNVISFETFDNQGYVTIESPIGTTIINCKAVGNPSPDDSPSNVIFTGNFLSFSIAGVSPGGNVSVILNFDDATTPDTYYKYGPTPSNIDSHWYEFLHDGNTGAEINGNKITLSFVNGQRGDDDLDGNNNFIVDVGGPGINVQPAASGNGSSGGGGGGGCYIGSATN